MSARSPHPRPTLTLDEIAADPGKATALTLGAAIQLLALAAGACEVLKALVTALQTGVIPQYDGSSAADRVLDVKTAATRLNVSRDYLYRHNQEFPFTVRTGRKIGFSERGLTDYLRRGPNAGKSR